MEAELVRRITEQVMARLREHENTGFGMGIPIGVSNRHVHLDQKTLSALFGNGYQLHVMKELSQKGEYAAEETVELLSNGRKLEGVRILGPCRAQCQVEISMTDARHLKINPPVRHSGELHRSEQIELRGPKGRVKLEEGCILASRHLHLSTGDAKRLNVRNDQIVRVRLFGRKPGVLDQVCCRVSERYVTELHLDTDEANAFLVCTGDTAQIIN